MLSRITRAQLMLLLLLVAAGAVAVAFTFTPAHAQNAPQAPVVNNDQTNPPVPGAARGGGFGGRRGQGGQGGQGGQFAQRLAQNPQLAQRLQMLTAPAAIAVAGEFVYVVKANTIYKFNAADLSLAAKAQLENLPALAGPAAGAGAAGGNAGAAGQQ